MERDERPLVTRQRCLSSGSSKCSPRPSDGSIGHRHGYRWNDVMRTKSKLTTLFGGLGQRNLGRCVSRRKFGLLCLVVGGFGTRMRVWWIWWRRNPLGGWYWRWPASGNSTWRLPRRCSCNWCCAWHLFLFGRRGTFPWLRSWCHRREFGRSGDCFRHATVTRCRRRCC